LSNSVCMTLPVAIGTVVDGNMWAYAAVLVQQLVQLRTALPIVVFNLSALPDPAVTLLHSLGANINSLDPPMVVPTEFSSPFLPRPFRSPDGNLIHSRYAPYAKLAVWGQTQWSNVDVVLTANIDEMGDFPVDTFSPETCNSLAPERCAAIPNRHATVGFNAGVMVVGPSASRFDSMRAFASNQIAGALRACANASNPREEAAKVENRYLAYPEQSFLKRYWPTVMGSTIEGGGAYRVGYDWQWVRVPERGSCLRTPAASHAAAPCTPPATTFMSRL
jgi:hypothetical protein